jgi:hypothetical protein
VPSCWEGERLKARLTPSLALRMLKKPSPRAMKLAMAAELPEWKTCVCCGQTFERPTHTQDDRRQLRSPGQWRRQRFCSAACTRQYRLEGPVREVLPPYLAVLEPETEP